MRKFWIVVSIIVLLVLGLVFLPKPVPEPKDGDAEVITELQKHGSDIRNIHHINFYLYFPTEENAREAGKRVVALYPDFTYDVHKLENYSEWTLEVFGTIAPDLSKMHKIRVDFTDIANQLSGDYDGWEAELVQE